MTYGKNQLALLKFLEKYPNRWHIIKGKKAIRAADRMKYRVDCFLTCKDRISGKFYVLLKMPQMLIKQN